MGREHHDLCFVCNRKIGKDASTFRIYWPILSAISICKKQRCHKHAFLLICITVWNWQILSLASCSNNKPRTSKVTKINYASLQNFFTWTGLFWNLDDVHWHGFAFEAFDRFQCTFCIYRYGMLERTEPITITIYRFIWATCLNKLFILYLSNFTYKMKYAVVWAIKLWNYHWR